MRTTIDKAGRLSLPGSLRSQLGLTPGTELDVELVDGKLELSVASRVTVATGRHGPHLIAEDAPPMSTSDVREIIDRHRR